jgi:hypothetical protein
VPQEAKKALIDYLKGQQQRSSTVDITLTFVPGRVPRAPCTREQVNTDQSLKNVATVFEVPYLVLRELLRTESPSQFDTKDCYTLVTYDGGVGVAQLTGATFDQLLRNGTFINKVSQYCPELRTDQRPSSVYNCLARSLQANIAGGAQVLNLKWDMVSPRCRDRGGTVQPRQIISNWVLPVARYKGVSSYLDPKVKQVFTQVFTSVLGSDNVVVSDKWSKPVYVATYDADALSELQAQAVSGQCTMKSFWANPPS